MDLNYGLSPRVGAKFECFFLQTAVNKLKTLYFYRTKENPVFEYKIYAPDLMLVKTHYHSIPPVPPVCENATLESCG